MQMLRTFLSGHRRLAALLIVLALTMKPLVPTGFMPAQPGKLLTVRICADASGMAMTRQIVIPRDGTIPGDHAKGQGACPYGGLGMSALAGGEQALLALAVAFAITLGFAPRRTTVLARLTGIRPPLRGPPARV